MNWSDITWAKYRKSSELIKTMPETVRKFHFEKDHPEADQIELLTWAVKWVSFWYDKGEEETELMDLNDLLKHYEDVVKFYYFEEIKAKKDFEFKGIKYGFVGFTQDIFGKETPMGGSTFNEFAEASTLKTALSKLEDGQIEVYPKLAAILYRPVKGKKVEPYAHSKTEQRMKDFEELPMDIILGSYFFLNKRSNTLRTTTLNSLKKKVEAVKGSLPIRGISKKRRSQRKASLTKKD